MKKILALLLAIILLLSLTACSTEMQRAEGIDEEDFDLTVFDVLGISTMDVLSLGVFSTLYHIDTLWLDEKTRLEVEDELCDLSISNQILSNRPVLSEFAAYPTLVLVTDTKLFRISISDGFVKMDEISNGIIVFSDKRYAELDDSSELVEQLFKIMQVTKKVRK